MRPGLRHVLHALGMAWTLPNSLIGLAIGAAGIPFGARAAIDRTTLAIVFNAWPWGPGGALTLGNVIVNTGADLDLRCHTYEHRAGRREHPAVRLGDHERAHVLQYMVLGPFFLPVYALLGGVSVRNPLERAADAYAMRRRGWWPWRLRAAH